MRTKTKGIKVLVTLLAVLSLSTLAFAVDCPVPDTGQTKCYNDDSEIICPSTGQPFYGQDAQYICNPQSYTKLDANGNDLPDDAPSWVMVRDNVTGLIWEVKNSKDGTPNYNNPHDADNTYTWYDGSTGTPGNGTDTLDFITALNDANFGGYNDWRLPTIKELSFLVDRDRYDPSINTTYFPNTLSSGYWSSTTYAYFPSYAWFVDFYFGVVSGYYKSGSNYYVRAVRGGQCGGFDNYIDNGDGTVTNTDTGLMWQQDTAPEYYTWQEALSYCETLTLANYTDWRLPNVNEFQSIVDYNRYNPSINTDYFPNTVSNGYTTYWSSTTIADDPYGAWLVAFGNGDVDNYFKSYDRYYVRAVRSGQCGSFDTSTTTTTIIAPCPTETLYGENSEETELLRYLRDNILNQTSEGQEIIRLYYEWSPVISNVMEKDEKFKEDMKQVIDEILEVIREEA